MSYCPACGNPVSSDADTRFCARCGKELPAAPAPPEGGAPVPPPPPSAPPTVHAAMPAAPAHAPAPTAPHTPPARDGISGMPGDGGPSPTALFLRRTFTGRWDLAAAAAVVPAVCFVALAVVIGAWSSVAAHDSGVGFVSRTRVALALLLTGVGATLHFTTRFRDFSDSGTAFSDSYTGLGEDDGSSGFPDGSYTTIHSTVSVIALAMTLLWVGSLVLALRRMRARAAAAEAANSQTAAGRSAAAEAAVRVALLAAAAALVLGLFAQPHVREEHLGTGPALLTLWAFLISLATALLTLCAPEIHRRLAVRPGLAGAARALGTALRALLITVGIAGVVVFVVVGAHSSDTTGWGVAFAALFLPNLGVAGLGLGWGAPFKVSESTDLTESSGSGNSFHFSYGLSELGHIWSGWAMAGAVVGGVVCALVIGVLAARRSADRMEQFLVAGLFTAMFVVLAAFGGVATDGGSGFVGLADGHGHSAFGTSVPEALMFALLWSCGGVLVGPWVLRALGATVPAPGTFAAAGAGAAGATGADPVSGPHLPRQAAPSAPSAPGQPPVPPQAGPAEPTVHDLGIVQPPRLNEPPDLRKPPDHR